MIGLLSKNQLKPCFHLHKAEFAAKPGQFS